MPIVGQFGSLAGFGMLPGGAFESIATVTVGSGGASSIEFASVPSGFQHLQIRYVARSTRSGAATDGLAIRLNGDTTTANYVAYHVLSGDGASAVAAADTSLNRIFLGNATGATASASIFGVGITDVLDYASTSKNKVFRTFSGHDRNGAGLAQLWSGMWMVTNAITSITLTVENGNFVQHSTAALYGLRA